MYKNAVLSLFVSLVWWSYPAIASAAIPVYKWNVGVDVPIRYTESFSTGEKGVIIEGTQTHVKKDDFIRYEIVKKGFWKDESFDKAEVKNEGNFKVELKAPSGDQYQIKIYGFGSMARGTFQITPY